MTQEQIFQLRLASVDLAIKAGFAGPDLVTQAASIYEYVAQEALAKLDARIDKAVSRLGLVTKPSITDIQDHLTRD